VSALYEFIALSLLSLYFTTTKFETLMQFQGVIKQDNQRLTPSNHIHRLCLSRDAFLLMFGQVPSRPHYKLSKAHETSASQSPVDPEVK